MSDQFRNSKLATKHAAAISQKIGRESVMYVTEGGTQRTRAGIPGDDWYGIGRCAWVVTSDRLLVVGTKLLGRADFWSIPWSSDSALRVDQDLVSVMSERECVRVFLDSPRDAEILGRAIGDARPTAQ